MADFPEPTRAEVNHLAEVISEAKLRGVSAGAWTLARMILAAGYQRPPEPGLTRYGECRACADTQPLTDAGTVVVHDDPRDDPQGRAECRGSTLTPLWEVAADGCEVLDIVAGQHGRHKGTTNKREQGDAGSGVAG